LQEDIQQHIARRVGNLQLLRNGVLDRDSEFQAG